MNAQFDIREEDLPKSLANIVRAIGMPATLKLIERYGGSRVYVPEPKHITVDHAIARAIGFDAARALSRLAGDERIEVPRAAGAFRLARDRLILRESRTASVSKLALKYHLSERQIYQIRRSPVRALRGSGEQREQVA